MKHNLFLNINKPQTTNTTTANNDNENVVTDIFEYVKTRIEIGIISPIELTDVYGLSLYVGIVLPEQLEFYIDDEIKKAQKGDFIIFDFDKNVFFVEKDNFRSFYRMSKASKNQQLLSAITIFGLNTTVEQMVIKETVNDNARASENEIFKELSEQILKGKVNERLLNAYKRVIESKYKDALINYTALSGYKARYFMSLLKKKNVDYALLTPLVDSIVDTEDDFDVDKITAINSYVALIATVANGVAANQIAACLRELNLEMEQAHSLDALSYSELLAFKSQLDSGSISLTTSIADNVLAQIKEEIIEQKDMFGANDVLVQDIDEIIK